MRYVLAGILAIVVGGTALAADAPKKSAFDKPTLEAYVRHLLLWGPQIQVSISEPKATELPGLKLVEVSARLGSRTGSEKFYISEDGQKIVRAAVYDITQSPFQKELETLDTAFDPSIGTPGAPVQMVVFSDFQCAFCQKEAEMLRKNLVQNYPTQVQLYFKDFPIPSLHPWAMQAAITGRCIYNQNQEAFWDYHDWVFAHQKDVNTTNIKAKVLEHAQAHGGLDTLKLGRCIDNQGTLADVQGSMKNARALGVNSTPTLFVNGRKIPSQIAWENLKAIIDLEIGYQQARAKEAEECCTLEIPTPLNQ